MTQVTDEEIDAFISPLAKYNEFKRIIERAWISLTPVERIVIFARLARGLRDENIDEVEKELLNA